MGDRDIRDETAPSVAETPLQTYQLREPNRRPVTVTPVGKVEEEKIDGVTEGM